MATLKDQILKRLVLRPDHNYGSLGYVQPEVPNDRQLADMMRTLLADLSIDLNEIPRRLHEDRHGLNYDCICLPGSRSKPKQEQYREQVRKLFAWADAALPNWLVEFGDDVMRPGDPQVVLHYLTEEFETWQVLTKRIAEGQGLPFFGHERYWAAVAVLVEQGLAEHRDIAARKVSA